MTDQQRTSGVGASGSEKATDRAAEKAREVKDRAESTAESVASEARERGREAVEEGKEKAREMGDRATRQARSRAEEQKERVAGGVRSLAEALRQGSRELPEDRRQYGGFLETVADRVEDVSGYLDQHDVDSMTRDARRLARDHTAAFLGGAFTLGVAGARFLKSSGSRSPQREAGGEYRSGPETGDAGVREPSRPRRNAPQGREPARPYPRSSTAREATQRIQEEGGHA